MGKVIRSVFIFSLVLVLSSCEYWNKDMLGYLEYWGNTVQMGRLEVNLGGSSQKNNAGVDAIPVSSTPTITGYIINPQGYPLVDAIGDDSTSNIAVRVSDSDVKDKTKLVAQSLTMLQVQVAAAEESLEHRTVTVDMEAIRSDTMVSAGVVMGVTFQYNTPPAKPMPVVKTDTGYKLVSGGVKWEASDDGTLYWAYYNETVETKPNCAKSFKINEQVVPVTDCNPVERESSLSGLTLYSRNTGGASTSVAAVDSERVTGSAIVSEQIVPPSAVVTYTVSYDPNEGTGDVPDPSTVTLGSSVTVGSGSLTRAGYIFDGWNTQKDGRGTRYEEKDTFTPTADTTLYAQWQVGAIINSADEAKKAIEEALNAARNGDEILIKLGANLTGNTVQGGAVVDVLSIDTTKDVSITIDGGGHTVDANGNGRGLRVDAENATVTVKNITLTGANHDSNTDGGGIFFLDGKQLILDSGTIITGNTLTGTNSHGGGVYVGNSDTTVIIKDNVTISDNEAVNGGGLCLSGSKPKVVMEGGTFSGNTARGNGGAVYIGDNPPTGGPVRFTMKDGVFNGTNSAAKGGNHIAIDQGMQEDIFVFHKDIGDKSTTEDGRSMIEVYTDANGYTSYVTNSKWEGPNGSTMGYLR